jgi:hypothetical protein
VIGWLLRLFGIGGARPPGVRSPTSRPPPPQSASRQHIQQLTREQLKLERRAVVIYVARARVPIRQAAAARQLWIQDLSKVYEAIRTSPTGLILEKAGEVGYRHEPAFREALARGQALTPPPPCEAVHEALIGWLTSLHAACLALIDARRLRDRSLLGNFREHLSQARRQARELGEERARLFDVYRLRVRPTIQRRPPAPVPSDAGTRRRGDAGTRGAPPTGISRAGARPLPPRGSHPPPSSLRPHPSPLPEGEGTRQARRR